MERFLHHISRDLRDIKREQAALARQQQQQQLPAPHPQSQPSQPPAPSNVPAGAVGPMEPQQEVREVC